MPNNKVSSLKVTFSIGNEIADDEVRFMKVVIDVLHTGLNYNGSIFEKDVVNSCVESIKNTPILGFIRYDESLSEDDFEGHEYIVTRTKNGIEEKYIGSAYGVIPESCNPRWITKMCDDQVEREFLQVDALMWTKFSDATNIMDRDVVKDHSMELDISSIEGYDDEDGIFHFTKFKFDGCCILGNDPNIQPAMINSTISLNFSVDEFYGTIRDELNDKFSKFTKIMNEKGETKNMPTPNYTQTVKGMLDDVSNIVKDYEKFTDSWGDAIPRYSLIDIQDDEVILVDRKNHYNYFGAKFTANGDSVNIDFANLERKKVRYEKYESSSEELQNVFSFGGCIADLEKAAHSRVDEEKTRYDALKSDYDTMKSDYEKLNQEKEERELAEISAKKDAEFARYESVLSGVSAFDELKEKKDDLSLKDIESECAILFAKKSLNFSKQDGRSLRSGIVDDTDDESGFVETCYGNIPVSR